MAKEYSLLGWDEDGEQVVLLELPNEQQIKAKGGSLTDALHLLARKILTYIDTANKKIGLPSSKPSWLTLERAVYIHSDDTAGLFRLDAINGMPEGWTGALYGSRKPIEIETLEHRGWEMTTDRGSFWKHRRTWYTGHPSDPDSKEVVDEELLRKLDTALTNALNIGGSDE